MTNSLSAVNQGVVQVLPIESLPDDVIGQIFSQMDYTQLVQAKVVCRRWEQIVTKVATTMEIEMTQRIGISILSQGREYPVLFSVKVHREVFEATNEPALKSIVLRLIENGHIDDALNVVNSIDNPHVQKTILGAALARLAQEDKVHIAQQIITTLYEAQAVTGESWLKEKALAYALDCLIAAGQDSLAEELFKKCWIVSHNTMFGDLEPYDQRRTLDTITQYQYWQESVRGMFRSISYELDTLISFE
jgi:hypothetical protein